MLKIYSLLLSICTLCICCNRTAEDKPNTETTENKNSEAWEKLELKSFYDQKGVVIAQMPFPANWEIKKTGKAGDPSITGPNGLKITDYSAKSFIYTNDFQMQQLYYQTGQQLRSMPGIENLIREDFEPWCANKGWQFVRHYELPEVAKPDKWYNDQLYKAMPTNTDVYAIGTEWKSADETPHFLLIRLFVSTGGNLESWYYMYSELEAEKEYFEKARKQLLFSLANTHYPLEPIMEYNAQEAARVGKSWAEHNKRMAQNQANFEASQRAFVNKSAAINNAIMQGSNSNSSSNDKSHEQFIDVITEQTNVHSEDGTQHKVSSGNNHYWMNTNGEYIGTNSANYNPNKDEYMNGENWQKLREKE